MTNKTRNLAVLLAAGVPFGTLAAPAALAGNAATAGDAGSPSSNTLQEVVVSGIRQSMASSLRIKENTMEVVDAISAEDIGKLPDPNVAETLTRVPGVQAYRYGGEAASPVGQGSGLTVRGLTGQTASRLNGRDFYTAGGREFNVEDAVPGLVSGIEVFKNPTAEHIEGGIGGLIDIHTYQPLDFSGLTVSTGAYEHYNDLGRKAEPEVFGLLSNRWRAGDGEMGLLIAGDYQETFDRSDSDPGNRGPLTRLPVRADSATYATLPGVNQAYAGRSDVWYLDSNSKDMVAANPQNLITILGAQKSLFEEDIHRVRKGLELAYQWRPNDQLELYAQGNYNYYLYDQRYRFMFVNDSSYVQNMVTQPYAFTSGFNDRNASGGSPSILSGQRIVSGAFLNTPISLMGGAEHHPYVTWLTAVGAKWNPTDDLYVHFDLSYLKSHVKKDNRDVTAVPRTGLTWDVTRDLLTTPHMVSFGGPSLSDPANFVYNSYDNGGNNVWSDDGYAPQLDIRYAVHNPLLTDIKGGLRYAIHNADYFDYSFGGRPLTTDGKPLAANQSNAISLASMPGLLQLSPTNWFASQEGFGGGYVVYSPLALWSETVRNTFPNAGIPPGNDLPENLLARRHASEKTYAGYIMGDFAWGDRIRGNVGVRVVKTSLYASSLEQSYVNSGQVDANGHPIVIKGPIVPYSKSSSYTDALPSLNITGYLTPTTLLRFGYSKGLTRADLGTLNPGISVNPATGSATGGNPDLKPLRADNYDISLEKYFSKESYASIDLFYKALHGFPFGKVECMTLPFAPPPTSGVCNGYEVTVPENAQDGFVKGVELDYQTFFTFLPGLLKDFGVSGSYAYLQTKNPAQLATNGPTVDVPMPFQSKQSWSVSGLFEHGPISARLIYTYRSDFVLFGVSADPSFGRYVRGYGLLDAALNIGLPVEGLSLSLNASNLTNAAANRYVGEPGVYASDFSAQNFLNGRNYSVGLRYTFRH